MKVFFVNKTSGVVAAVVIFVLAATFALYSTTFVDSSGKVYEPNVETRVTVPNVTSLYYITVGEKIVFTDETMSVEEAQAYCETVAYSPDNMWKQVVCTYSGVEIYNDIFIAG